jgi:hypothetical protein
VLHRTILPQFRLAGRANLRFQTLHPIYWNNHDSPVSHRSQVLTARAMQALCGYGNGTFEETAMQHTLAAIFEEQSQAQHALDDLVASGFSRNDVRLSQGGAEPQASGNQAGSSPDDQSLRAEIRSFFVEVFGPSRDVGEAELYSEAIRRGNYVLTVNVLEDELVDRATDVLDRYDPVDIDEQVSQWKSGGWAAPESMRQNTAQDSGSEAQRGGVRVYPRSSTGQSYAAGSEGGSEESAQLADVDDTYYREHWNSNYADAGDKYEDYAPAYQYGSRLAGSDRYQGRRWNDVESDVRSDWESRNPGSTWEKFKAAIRHGWERMTS